jgi:phage portal protein BeeE
MNANQFASVISKWRGGGASNVSTGDIVVSTGDSGVDLLNLFGAINTASGYTVNDQTAMTVATVYRCVAIIGGAISQLPLHHYRKLSNGSRERVSGSALWWLLNESPADAWTSAAWKEHIAKSVLLRGDSFADWCALARLSQRSNRTTPIACRSVSVTTGD